MANTKILALDLDGVIFSFNKTYAEVFKEKFNIIIPPETSEYPDEWNYEEKFATKAQIDQVWKWINTEGSYRFWRFMPTYDGAKTFLDKAMEKFDDVYFVTSRSGDRAKIAT